MKKYNNFLCCVAVILFTTCFIFSLTITSNTASSAKASENIETSAPISIQQREIKSGLKRIEKKLQQRRKINAN